MNKAVSILFVAALGTASSVTAAPPAGLAEALDAAMANRPELAIEREHIAAAQGRIDETKAALLPTLNLTLTSQKVNRYDTYSGVTASAIVGGQPVLVDVAATSPRYQTDAGLELGWNLYDGGASRARISEAVLARRSALARRSVTARAIAIDVAERWATWTKASLAHARAVRAAELARQELDIMTGRMRSGDAPAIDIRESEIKQRERELALRAAERTLGAAARDYCTAVGNPCDGLPTASPGNVTAPGLAELKSLYTKYELIGDAARAGARTDYEAADQRIKQVRAQYRPSIDLFAQYLSNSRSESSLLATRNELRRNYASIGFKLTWTLFNGHRTDSALKQEVAVREEQRLRAELAERERERTRQTARDEIAGLEDRLTVEQAQCALAEEKQRIAAQRLALQRLSRIDYARIDDEVDAARARMAVTAVELSVARLKLELP